MMDFLEYSSAHSQMWPRTAFVLEKRTLLSPQRMTRGDLMTKQTQAPHPSIIHNTRINKKMEGEDEETGGELASNSSKNSGSGGGYAADCSDSDQSSSEDNGPKSRKSAGGEKSEQPQSSSSRRGDDEGDDGQETDAAAIPMVMMSSSSTIINNPVLCKENNNGSPDNHSPDVPTSSSAFAAATNENENLQLYSSFFPQWNGISISNPLDPRIDLTHVNIQATTTTSPTFPAGAGSAANENAEQVYSVEQYKKLFEAVRPFFMTHPGLFSMVQPLPVPKPTAQGSYSSQAPSSEGFTSFFTTTDTSGNNTHNKGGGGGSSGTTSDSPTPPQGSSSERPKPQDTAVAADDCASSITVLARPKRKKREEDRTRRVRIRDERQEEQLQDAASRHEDTPDRTTKSQPAEPPLPPLCESSSVRAEAKVLHSNKQRKLLDKKRKRIEMRREYEAQFDEQPTSVAAAAPRIGEFFRPGKPLALDQAIVFSTIPRTPPFLVVHSNAAFCRLTGIDSHVVEGKPVGFLLSVMPGEIPEWPLAVSPPFAAADKDDGRTNLERLLVTCGYGHLHVVQVQTKPVTKSGRMLGRSETKESTTATAPPSSRVQTTEVNEDKILCKVSIAPIISSAGMVGVEAEPYTKTKTIREEQDDQQQHVSHFVIQFEPKTSSTTSESRIALGGLQGSASESSQALAAVA